MADNNEPVRVTYSEADVLQMLWGGEVFFRSIGVILMPDSEFMRKINRLKTRLDGHRRVAQERD